MLFWWGAILDWSLGARLAMLVPLGVWIYHSLLDTVEGEFMDGRLGVEAVDQL